MGPTTIAGLPAHALLVHIVVVMVPLTALLVILTVLWPAAQRRLGIITPLVAFATLVAVPLTTQSGEWLEHHTERNPLVEAHTHLGDQLLIWSIAVFLLSTAWWVIHSERARNRLRSRVGRVDAVSANRTVALAIAIVAVVVAAGSAIQVYRIGDSGAKAVWHDQTD
jgi:hypothetical protein